MYASGNVSENLAGFEELIIEEDSDKEMFLQTSGLDLNLRYIIIIFALLERFWVSSGQNCGSI